MSEAGFSTYSDEKYTWNVEDLWRAAEGLPPIELPLTEIPELDDMLGGYLWFKHGFEEMTPEEMLEHDTRIEQALLSFPIILTPDGFVADGIHRIFKSLRLGHSSISAVKLTKMPPPVELPGAPP